jgi:hypothetical protein
MTWYVTAAPPCAVVLRSGYGWHYTGAQGARSVKSSPLLEAGAMRECLTGPEDQLAAASSTVSAAGAW